MNDIINKNAITLITVKLIETTIEIEINVVVAKTLTKVMPI